MFRGHSKLVPWIGQRTRFDSPVDEFLQACFAASNFIELVSDFTGGDAVGKQPGIMSAGVQAEQLLFHTLIGPGVHDARVVKASNL